MQVSAVKQYALEHQIPVLTPLNLKDENFLEDLQQWNADLQIVVAFRMLPEIVWNAPKYGTFNLHASLLPQYRGAAPINHAIINGETESGVTTFFLDKKIDTGRIIAQKKCAISDTDSAGDLHDKLMDLGAVLVKETVQSIIDGKVNTIAQEEYTKDIELKKAPKVFKEDGLIDWNQEARAIHNKIRGLSPYPTAWTRLRNMNNNADLSMKIYVTRINMDCSDSSSILKSDGKTFLRISALDYCIDIQELQLQGKKRMKVTDFLRGFPNINEWEVVSFSKP
jgi:methionyl-tRNA formyltransferase